MGGYRIELTPDDNGTVLVTCPDLPEVTTFAETAAEAALRARDAIEEALASRMADHETLPELARGESVASLPALTLAKVELYRALTARGIGVAQLADRLGVRASAAQRLLDLNHPTALPEIEAAFRAIGLRLDIEVSTAA
ncbi:MAG: type II toxin-antitoxin system HicB family antitoxin [Geminicoccaceae bacterium]